MVEEEVVGDYGGEQPGEEATTEITFIDEEHKTETEETVTVYEVVGNEEEEEECQHEEEWVEEVQLHNGETVSSSSRDNGVVEEMVFEEEAVVEEGEQVIYVTDDGQTVEGDVTFMQVLGKTYRMSFSIGMGPP